MSAQKTPADQEAGPSVAAAPLSEPRQPRVLVKGALNPPTRHIGGAQSPRSYTLPPAMEGEVTIRKAADRKKPIEPVEVDSGAVAQPFVDPAILEKRRGTG